MNKELHEQVEQKHGLGFWPFLAFMLVGPALFVGGYLVLAAFHFYVHQVWVGRFVW